MRSRGVLDAPLEPVIGLAEGETRVAGHDGRRQFSFSRTSAMPLANRSSATGPFTDCDRMVEAAVTAASTILTKSVKGEVADDLLAKGIAEVREKLN